MLHEGSGLSQWHDQSRRHRALPPRGPPDKRHRLVVLDNELERAHHWWHSELRVQYDADTDTDPLALCVSRVVFSTMPALDKGEILIWRSPRNPRAIFQSRSTYWSWRFAHQTCNVKTPVTLCVNRLFPSTIPALDKGEMLIWRSPSNFRKILQSHSTYWSWIRSPNVQCKTLTLCVNRVFLSTIPATQSWSKVMVHLAFLTISPFLPPSPPYNVGSVRSKCSPWSNIVCGGEGGGEGGGRGAGRKFSRCTMFFWPGL